MTEQERQAFISNLSFEGEIEDCEGVFRFTVKKDFDLAAAFEGIYDPAADPPIRRIDLAYRITDQMVWYTMGLDFGPQPGMLDHMRRVFPLSDRERERLKENLDGYCLHQTGMSLLEYGILHWSEDDGPRPTLTDLTAQTRLEQPAARSMADIDLMEWFAIQCVDQMVQDIQSRVTPEEGEKIVAEAEQTEELGSDLPDFMGFSM
ncbi:MAG: hypothetical protein K2P37_13690 [Oscillospiraceae bacterium]|nr:hypothetical protein [Oscillospiraceae bacterium]